MNTPPTPILGPAGTAAGGGGVPCRFSFVPLPLPLSTENSLDSLDNVCRGFVTSQAEVLLW